MFEKQNLKERCLTLEHWRWILKTAKLQKDKEIEIKDLSKAQKSKVRDEQFDLGQIATVIFPSQNYENVMLELDNIINTYTTKIVEELEKQLVTHKSITKIFDSKYHSAILEHLNKTKVRLENELCELSKAFALSMQIGDMIIKSDIKIKELNNLLSEHKVWKEKNLPNKNETPSFIRYEIEKRDYSPNIIVGVYRTRQRKQLHL